MDRIYTQKKYIVIYLNLNVVRDQCGSSTEPCVICSQRAHATTVADVSVYSANYLDRESFSPISVLARTRHVRWKQKTETKEISE